MAYYISRTSPILFGAGAAQDTGAKVKELGCKRVLLVTDQGIRKAGIADRVQRSLEGAGLEVVVYDRVPPDPPDYLIEEAADLARREAIDGIVAVGGGSVMDAAKGVNVLLTNPPPISQYFGVNAAPNLGKVLVLLPTTSGTGSEVTAIAVVTDTQNQRKIGVIGPYCCATLAIVDPELAAGMPPAITAATGMDALAHAVEAITSALANPISDVLAERAVGLIARYLPAAVRNGADLEARTNMSLAATLAGIAFNDALPHLGHAIAHVLGAKFHIPHGVGCAVVLPEVMEFAAEAVPDKVRSVGRALGLDLAPDLSAEEVGRKVGETIRSLSREVGIPTFGELKLNEAALLEVVPAILKDDTAAFAPKPLTPEIVSAALRKAYQNYA
ncbi:MAG: iron-containing alcohol dehydrogenase [Moorellales bacterium]